MDNFLKTADGFETALKLIETVNRATDDYLFVWDIGADKRWFFGDIDKHYNIRKNGSATNSTPEMLKIIHPADSKAVLKSLEQIAAGKKDTHNMNYRWINRNRETVWINGHGTAMGGVIVDGGNYNWANGKFPQIDGPSEGYHGLNLHEAFGSSAFIIKCRVDGLRDLGCCPSPFDSYLMMLGLETLTLRVRHEVESTRKLAEYCRNHPKVERVSYVGFEDHPSYTNAQKYYKFGSSAVFTIELKGTLESTVRFVESLHLAANMTMIGDSISVVTHPASTTHKQLSEADLVAAGVTPTLLRISLGLEHVDDLIDDFEQAFAQIK